MINKLIKVLQFLDYLVLALRHTSSIVIFPISELAKKTHILHNGFTQHYPYRKTLVAPMEDY